MRTLLSLALLTGAAALVPNAPGARRHPLTPRKGFFDNAFKNESFDNKPKAGGAPAKKTVPVTIGSRTVQALPNQRLKDVVRAARSLCARVRQRGMAASCSFHGRLARSAGPPMNNRPGALCGVASLDRGELGSSTRAL